MRVSQHRVQLTPEGRVHGIQRFWLVQNQMGHLRGGAEGEKVRALMSVFMA